MKATQDQKSGKSKRAYAAIASVAEVDNPSAEGGCPPYSGEESCRIAGAMARIGATVDDVSEALGVSVSTLHVWRRTYSDFSEALRASPAVSVAAVERAMIRCALGFNYTTEKLVKTRMGAVVRAHPVHVPPNVEAAHFMLRARMPALYGRRREDQSGSAFLKALTHFNKVANEKREVRSPEGSCRVLRTMARLGAADSEMAAALGISLPAFNDMRSTQSGFSEALGAGEEVLNAALERALLQRANGYSYVVEKFVCAPHGEIIPRRRIKHLRPDAKAQDIWAGRPPFRIAFTHEERDRP